MVFERVLTNPESRYDEYLRILNVLDVDYNSDYEAFKRILNSKSLMKLFNDPQLIRAIYKKAKERVAEDDVLVIQQEAIFEMHSSGGSVQRAGELLEIAHIKDPKNTNISHALAEFLSNKAKKAKNDLEKNKYRNDARKLLAKLIKADIMSAYPYHTMIKLELDVLEELLKIGDETVIERKIKDIERLITQALQEHPYDEFILDADSRYSEIVEKNPQAIRSLERAFDKNKRSHYIASRLSKLYQKDGKSEKAIEVLKECLDENPSSKEIHFQLAMILKKLDDPPHQDVLYHLRHSFTKGDSNYTAQ